MTANIQSPQIKMLCMLAQDDESALQYPLPDQIFGFLAQQSCEKLLKALLGSNGVAYPLTHQLGELYKLLARCQETLPSLSYDPLQLVPFAVLLRYQYGPPLPESDRLAIRDSVAKLREHVVARILELERLSNP